jgi:hypothetical protein
MLRAPLLYKIWMETKTWMFCFTPQKLYEHTFGLLLVTLSSLVQRPTVYRLAIELQPT